jgi:nitrite reductase (NADH) small subunit/3-phenylpropionate/trans-cinnamate dioxygenase ferredoxin subunit
MTHQVTVAKVGDIPAGEGRAFQVENLVIAVFFDGTAYHAIDDFCPHMGASLSGGMLENGVVCCPWHAWRFRVCDGTWCDNPRIKIASYPVTIDGDTILITLPDSQGP